jgi:hypothetical protein
MREQGQEGTSEEGWNQRRGMEPQQREGISAEEWKTEGRRRGGKHRRWN